MEGRKHHNFKVCAFLLSISPSKLSMNKHKLKNDLKTINVPGEAKIYIQNKKGRKVNSYKKRYKFFKVYFYELKTISYYI